MDYRALKTFAGVVSMRRGEVKDIKDQEIANGLLNAGYIEEVANKAKDSKSSKPARKRGGNDDE